MTDVEMTSRKLVSARRISKIDAIPGADAIEVATVDGWQVVVKKGEFSIGDQVAYLEVDSWVPYHLAPFLSKGKEPREFQGIKGERLRTIKLRGQISQGLILPIFGTHEDGDDLTDITGVVKWERPIPAQLQGKMKGNFPSFIRKTDQERIQNMPELFAGDLTAPYEVTLKLDGSSMTVYWHNGEFGVCSRNIDLKLDQDGNTFVDTAKRLFADKFFDNIAIQGELIGPAIQGNMEGLAKHEFFVFDIWDIVEQAYWTPSQCRIFCDENSLNHVPIIGIGSLPDMGITDMGSMLSFAEGKSLNHPVREGVVFKRVDGGFSFKAISNKFLLGETE